MGQKKATIKESLFLLIGVGFTPQLALLPINFANNIFLV